MCGVGFKGEECEGGEIEGVGYSWRERESVGERESGSVGRLRERGDSVRGRV